MLQNWSMENWKRMNALRLRHCNIVAIIHCRIESMSKQSQRGKKKKVNGNKMKISTYSHTSNTTCCNKSGNFCTIVTGWPDVKLTPYIGAVVLYRVLQRRAGVALHFSDGLDNERAESREKHKRTNRIHTDR